MSLSPKTRQVIGLITMWCFLLQNTVVFAASNIQTHDTYRTNTTIDQHGNVFDISTETNVNDMGVNSFKKFDVGNGDTVNLKLSDAQNKILNLVFDSSASQIDGVVNSYKNGQIGGNVLFANPNGFVIGKDGVFNVGSLSLMTPTQNTMESLFDNGKLLIQPITDLVSFEIDDNRLLKLKGKTEIDKDAVIDIKGEIKAQKGVDIIAGKEVNVSGKINANLADILVNTGDDSFTTAIFDGNNIVIVTKDQMASHNKKGNTVKISGKIDARDTTDKAGNILISAQSQSTHNDAEVVIQNGAVISGNNVEITAVQSAADFDSNVIGASDDLKSWLGIGDDLVEYFTPNFADLSAKVTIENGAIINAKENLKIASEIDAKLSSSMIMAMLSVNYTQVDAVSEVLVESGAELTAKNLDVTATNDVEITASSKSSSLDVVLDKDKAGDLAVVVLVSNINTAAVIEKGVTLKIAEDLNLEAKTKNHSTMTAKNGVIPVIDVNKANGFSGSIAVAVADVVTKAVMNADADLKGSLKVNAETDANTVIRSTTSLGGSGETGLVSKYGQTFIKNLLFGEGTGQNFVTKKIYGKMNDIKTRGNAEFNKFDLAAAISVAVADYVTEASIGDETVRPVIAAKNVEVTAKTVDNKSNVSAIAKAENAESAVAGAVAVHIKDLQTKALAYGDFTIKNDDEDADALKVFAQTDILHPLSYYDNWNKLVDSLKFGELFSDETWKELKALFEGSSYTDADGKIVMPDLNGVTDKLFMPNLDILLKGPINMDNFGLESLYNTYAQAASAAKSTNSSTKAFSGAININVMDSLAEAGLGNGSKISMLGSGDEYNKTNIASAIENQIWIMSGIFSPLNFTEILSGASARDGSSYGAGIAFNYADNDAKAYIGEGVVIEQESQKMGDISVAADTNGNYVNVVFGSANADDSGMSGAVGLTLIGGETTAYVGKGSTIDAKDLKVSALIDANYINAVTGISNSQESIAVGISGIGIFDTVKAYVDGNIWAEGNVTVDATSDRLLVNVTNNIAVAKSGTNPPEGARQKSSQDMMDGDDDFSLGDTFVGKALGDDKLPGAWGRTKLELGAIEDAEKLNFNWERSANPDKETKAYAGSINANVITSAIDAFIADGATVRSGKDLAVNATADVLSVNEAAAVSAKGKSGGGGAVVIDVVNNDATAKIGKGAVVDVLNKLSINALQDYMTIQAGVGVAVAKNSSGAGTIGTLVQVNNTKAYIDEGAEINQKEDNVQQSVELTAKNEASLIKGLGAVAVQAGASEGATSSKAVGGTLDGNVIVNTAEATIKGTENNRTAVKANDGLKLEAVNDNFFVNADVAGSVSTGGSAYAGLAATNILINDTIAGISYADITGGAGIEVGATDKFREIVVAAALAIGRDRGMGATVRGDVLANNIKTYVENSDITAKSLEMNNSSVVDLLAVSASGAGSSDGKAMVGTVSALVALSNQENKISDSEVVLSNDLKLDSKSNLDIIAATGSVAVSLGDSSAGGSMFAAVAKNNVKTFIKNTNISAAKMTVASSAKEDVVAVTAGGSLSTGGSAYAGAISTIVNLGDTEAYVDGGVQNLSGSADVSAKKETDVIQVAGQASISANNAAVGGAVATTVNTNKVKAYVNNAKLSAANGVNVIAESIKKFISTPVGVSGGSGVSVQGSLDTYVIAANVEAFIKDGEVDSGSDIAVKATEKLDLASAAGGVSASSGDVAVGAAMFTGVFTGATKAYVENVKISGNGNDLTVAAKSSENLGIGSISGGVSGGSVAATGVVQTIVIDKDTKASVDGVTSDDDFGDVSVTADSTTDLVQVVGQAAISMGSVGAGGSVETTVVNKNVNADIANSKLSAKDKLDLKAGSKFDNVGTVVGVSVGSSAAVQGAVSTKVLNIDTKAKVADSTIEGTSVQNIGSSNTFDIINTMGTLSASGTASVGGTVGTLVNSSTSYAGIEGSTIDGKSLTMLSDLQDDYIITLANGAASGTAAVAGAVNTVVLNTESEAEISKTTANYSGGDVDIKAENRTDVMSNLAQAAGSGTAAVGASVTTFVSNKATSAAIKGSTLDVDGGKFAVAAKSFDDVFSGVAGGAGSGVAAVIGSVNTIVFDNETTASIDDSTVGSTADSSVTADENLNLGGYAGAAAGAGVAAVGASVITGVINNKTQALVTASDANTANLKIAAKSVENIGNGKAPIINIAGSGAGVTNVNGVVNTFVNTSETKAKMSGKKAMGSDVGNLNIEASSQTDAFMIVGSGGGAGVASVGATVGTIVNNKDVEASIEDVKLDAGNITLAAKSIDKISSNVAAGGGAGVTAVNGAVNTNVIANNVWAKIVGGDINAYDVDVKAMQNTELFAIAGSASGAIVGVGASVLSNVLENDVSALVDAKMNANKVDVTAEAAETLTNTTVSGAGGAGAAAGAVSTNVIGNAVKAGLRGNVTVANDANVKASDVTTFKPQTTGTAAIGGIGAGASVMTNVINNEVNAFVGGNIKAENLNVVANAEELMDDLYAMGFAVGASMGGAGTVVVNTINSSVLAFSQDGTIVDAAGNFKMSADSKTTVNSLTIAGAAGMGVGVGASVMVNNINKSVGAYTGTSNVIGNAQLVDLQAKSINLIGEQDKSLKLVAGAVSGGYAIAGTVLVNNVTDTVVAGLGANNVADVTDVKIAAENNTAVYTDVGAGAVGKVGVGAMVNVNTVNNTVNSFVGTNSLVDADGAFDMKSTSDVKLTNSGYVVAGGLGALSGGVIVSNVGQEVAALNEDAEVNRNAASAKAMADNATTQANNKVAESKAQIAASVNEAKNKAESEMSTAKGNTDKMIADGMKANLSGEDRPKELQDYTQEQKIAVQIETPASAEMSAPAATVPLRNKTISAIVDAGAAIYANSININAKDTTNLSLKTTGANLGAAAVGVSGNVANVASTTEVLIGSNTRLEAQNKIDVNAVSEDTTVVNSVAASGGVVSGSGNFAAAYSKKTTRVQTLTGAEMASANDDINIKANADANVSATAKGGNFGGIAVGASIAKAFANGTTAVLIGASNKLNAIKGNINVSALSKMGTNSLAEALAGALLGGTGADSRTSTGQNVSVEAGADLDAVALQNLKLTTNANNSSKTTANSRSYGVVAAGGSTSVGDIVGGTKINIADGSNGKIKAKDFLISSEMLNDVFAKTYAGSGAIVGINGSQAATNINVANNIYVGRNLKINTTGNYGLIGSTKNSYAAYNDSSAYGLVAAGAGLIRNNVNSTVNVTSNADVDAGSDLSLYAYNETVKGDKGYDMEGGAGGLVGVGSANLKTGINHDTTVNLGGNMAHAKGELTAMAENYVNVTEKVKVHAAGGVPVAAGYAHINRNNEKIDATVNIENKDIRAQYDTLYSAKSDIRMFAKSDVTTRGLAPVADGESFATGMVNNTVNIKNGSNTDGRRDVFVEALNRLSITSQMYSDSEGLLWDFGDADVQAKSVVANKILSETGSVLSAFDKMTISTGDSSSLDGTKTARTRFYLIFGIPITIYEHGNSGSLSKTSKSSSNKVVINGTVKSGEGANREMTINGSDDIEGNMSYTDKEVEIEVSEEDLKKDMDVLVGDYDSKSKEFSNKKTTAQNGKNAAKRLVDENTATKNAAAENIRIAEAESAAYLGLQLTAEDGVIVPEADRSKTSNAVLSDTSLQNRTALSNKINAGEELSVDEIVLVNQALEHASERELAKIPGERIVIAEAEKAIENNNELIKLHENAIKEADDALAAIKVVYDENMELINAQLAEIAGIDKLKLSMIDVKDTIVRSGEVVINGDLSGTGTITAPGDVFSITVNNNTPNSVSFNKLVIENDVRGKIYVNNKDIIQSGTSNNQYGVNASLKNAGSSRVISLNNNVDAMDPSSSLNRLNNAGDMIFYGLIQNTRGDLLIRNLTGDIISEAPMYAKTISMFVPNGSLDQGFTNSQTDIGGASGDGAGIYAAGDITIMARTINVNGLIQSGTIDKNVLIQEFTLRDDNTLKACDANSTACSQLINGQWVSLEKSPNKDKKSWFLLSGDALTGIDMTDPNNPDIIKAYYDAAKDEIVLFRAEISGGDITLVGDVVSSNNKGEIRLMSGYGHIDIKNESGKNLVVSDLNADAKLDGKLAIYDFRDDLAQDDTLMNNLEKWYKDADKKNLENSLFWSEMLKYAGVYTAKKENGSVAVSNEYNGNSSSMVNDATGTWFAPSSGSVALQGGGQGFVSVLKYIPRSWLVELFVGKKYEYVDVAVSEAPKLAANNNIKVSFSGYEDAKIDIASNSDIRINENISVIDGDITVLGNNIWVDAINNNSMIRAKNVNLTASGDIGAANDLIKDYSMKIELNGGGMEASGDNVYLSLLNGDAKNFEIKAEEIGYLNVVRGNFEATDASGLFEANDVQIKAENGSITANDNLKSGTKLSLWAKDDIDVAIKEDINAAYIRSDEGNISLKSEGSINSIYEGSSYYATIMGKDINLTAANDIGKAVDGGELNIEGTGKINAKAGGDVNIRSLSDLYVDTIEAGNDVRLISDMGILNANGEKGTNVKANNLLAVAVMGNIENLDVDLDGEVTAYAGYKSDKGGWLLQNAASSITINQSSQKLSETEAGALSDDEKAKLAGGLKDMKIDHIQAQKIFLNAERDLKNAGNGAILQGSNAVLTATNGSVGELSKFVNVSLDGSLAAYAKDSVFVESAKDLRIFEIMGIEDKQIEQGVPSGADALEMVHLKSGGNILDDNGDFYVDENGDETVNEKYNVIAKNVVLEAAGTIGTDYDDFNVYTTDATEKGLNATGSNIFVSSMHDLIADEINADSVARIQSRYIDQNGDDIWKDVIINKLAGSGDVTIIAENATIGDIAAGGVFNGYVNDTINLSSAENINLGIIEGIDHTFTNSVNIVTDKDLLNAAIGGGDNIRAKDTNIAAQNVGTDDKVLRLRVPTEGGSLDLAASGEAYLDVVGDGPLGIGDLSAAKAVISVAENTSINNAVVGDLDLTAAKDLNIDNLSSNLANIDVLQNFSGGNIDSTTANITSGANIDVNTLRGQTANLAAGGNIGVDDAVLGTIFNASTDNSANIGSSGDLNLGTIGGLNGVFSNSIALDVAGNIVNAAGGSVDNLRAAKTDIQANDAGSSTNPLNLRVPAAGGFVDMVAQNDAYLNIVGDGPVAFGKLQGNTISLATPFDLLINGLVANRAFLTNGTPRSTILSAMIRDYAEIRTSDKMVVIDNHNLAPRYDANAQIFAPGKQIGLVLDHTQRIGTAFENVTRHNTHNTILNPHERQSMNSNIFQDAHSAINIDRHVGIAESGSMFENSLLRWNDYYLDGSIYKDIWQKYIEDWFNVSDTEELALSGEGDESPNLTGIEGFALNDFANTQQYALLKNYVNIQ